MGLPLAFRIGAPSMRLKSPVRKSAVGTEKSVGAAHALERAFPVREEEQLVLLDRAAEAAAVDVADALRALSVTPARFSSQVNARKRAVVVHRERAAVEVRSSRTS